VGILAEVADGASAAWRLIEPKARVRLILRQFFENSGLTKGDFRPSIGAINQTDYGYRVIIHLFPGKWIGDVWEKLPELGAAFNAEAAVQEDGSGWLILYLYTRGLPGGREGFPYRIDLAARVREYDFGFPVGVCRDGFYVLDMARDEYCGILAGGITGSGKTYWLRQGLVAICTNYTPEEAVLYLVDMKDEGLELRILEGCPHVAAFGTDQAGSMAVLQAVTAELRRRSGLFAAAGVSDIAGYRATGHQLAHMALMIDEFADLPDDGKDMVIRFGRVGRYAGLHPIVCTQRPDRDTLPPALKANLPVSMAFRTKNELNSRMIIDGPQAAHINKADKGRAFILADRARWVQVVSLPRPAAEKLLAPCKQRPMPAVEVKTWEPISELMSLQELNVVREDDSW